MNIEQLKFVKFVNTVIKVTKNELPDQFEDDESLDIEIAYRVIHQKFLLVVFPEYAPSWFFFYDKEQDRWGYSEADTLKTTGIITIDIAEQHPIVHCIAKQMKQSFLAGELPDITPEGEAPAN